MRRHELTILAILGVCLVLALSSTASACPSCQAALAGDTEAANYARGVYYSILFMLSMPFAITGVWVGAVYRMVKRQQREQAVQAGGQNNDRQANLSPSASGSSS